MKADKFVAAQVGAWGFWGEVHGLTAAGTGELKLISDVNAGLEGDACWGNLHRLTAAATGRAREVAGWCARRRLPLVRFAHPDNELSGLPNHCEVKPLLFASLPGRSELVKATLDEDADVNEPVGRRSTATAALAPH